MTTTQRLRQMLHDLERQSYKAYRQIEGRYSFPGFVLLIDHVQGDPFAAPSRLRIQIPQTNPAAAIPADLYRSPIRAVALSDYLTRQFDQAASHLQEKRGSGNSGLIAIAHPVQQVLERTSVLVDHTQIEARFGVGLPARGRQILGREAAALLCDDLPHLVARSLFYSNLNDTELRHHIETVEDSEWVRSQLEPRGLVAFIPDGAMLPRRSGVDDRPLDTPSALPFRSPDSLRVSFQRPNGGPISGMGIPTGITLIVGGGYHGKSTLLRAIAMGVYNHIPGDGREGIGTHAAAVKIRAEDGRSITGVNISPFINHLPQGRSTTQFSTDNASGSTSQAAAIMEALEAGARVLLVDEDTSATNFMIRDRRMQALIAKEREPITPFLDKIRQLYQEYGISTILVMGGSGDYFDVADTVLAMTEFEPEDVTAKARQIAQHHTTARVSEGGDRFGDITPRAIRWVESSEEDRRGPRIKVRDVDELVVGWETVDLAAVEQLVDVGQLRALGAAIVHLQRHSRSRSQPLSQWLNSLMEEIDQQGWDGMMPFPQGDLARFRSLELAAAINRMRSLRTD